MTESGKGDRQRPRGITDAEWADRYALAFSKEVPEEKPTLDELTREDCRADAAADEETDWCGEDDEC